MVQLMSGHALLRRNKIESHRCGTLLEIRTVVPYLKRVFNEQGISLLIEHKWLWGLIKAILIKNTLEAKKIHLSDEQLADGKVHFLRERGYESLDDWTKYLQDSNDDENSLIAMIRKKIEYDQFLDINYSSKAEAQFLGRKND